VYGDESIDLPDLQGPHPGISERNFVLLPLREIAPQLVIPGLGQVIGLKIDEQHPLISRID
jgi:2-amino-4-hydroxy-6-hydroxymethyldihydropteridine diphosphokinase